MKPAVAMCTRLAAVIGVSSLAVLVDTAWGEQPKNAPSTPTWVQNAVQGDLKLGESVYKEICFSCHGDSGDGRGPNWRTTKPAPQVFANPEYMSRLTDEYLFQVVKHGKLAVLKDAVPSPAPDIMPMPAFERILTDDQIRRLIAFAWSFLTGASKDSEIRQVFLLRCARCHGENGRGDGPLAKPAGAPAGPFVSLIQPAPADYTDRLFMTRFDDDFLFWLIKKGRIGAIEEKAYDTMQPFGDVLTDEEIKSVVRYIRETFVKPAVRIGRAPQR